MNVGRESISPEHDIFYVEEDARGVVYTVQPEEISSYKALRRVIDREFLSRDAFVLSTPNYFQVFPSVDGINTHLRTMLFLPSKQWRRGHVRDSEHAVEDSQDPGKGKVDGKKQTQRQSKQKERCENRLLSLLFACIYDPGTRDCLLAKGIPPLKLRKEDKNGKYRYVSNFTVVRAFLRHVVTHITAAYASSVRIIQEMAPSSTALLPTTFMLIARTFIMMVERRTEVSDGPELGRLNNADARSEAQDYVCKCLTAIRKYLTSWEKRNYTTDNPLTNCLQAVKDDVIYESAANLLKAMIGVVPPPPLGPQDKEFRKNLIYSNSLPQGVKCKMACDEYCLMMGICPGQGPSTCTPAAVTACHTYLEAFLASVNATDTADAEVLDELLQDSTFATIHWRYAMSLADLHRVMAKSREMKTSGLQASSKTSSLTSEFVSRTVQEVACFWAALSRSNVQADAFLNGLNIPNTEEHTATIVELVFGGGFAARVSLERRKLIVPISSKLLSKKGGSVDQPKFATVVPQRMREGESGTRDAAHQGKDSRTQGSLQSLRHDAEQNIFLSTDQVNEPDGDLSNASPILNSADIRPTEGGGVSSFQNEETECISGADPNNQVGRKKCPISGKIICSDPDIPSEMEPPKIVEASRPFPSTESFQRCSPNSSKSGPKRRRGRVHTVEDPTPKPSSREPKKKKRRYTMLQTVQDAQASGSLPAPGTSRRKRINNKK